MGTSWDTRCILMPNVGGGGGGWGPESDCDFCKHGGADRQKITRNYPIVRRRGPISAPGAARDLCARESRRSADSELSEFTAQFRYLTTPEF